MEEIEVAWQNCETKRDKYVKKTYDVTRGGAKLSKGNLYCPVFKNHFHKLFFLDLPVDDVLEGVHVPVLDSAVRALPAAGSNTNVPVAEDDRGQKRARTD
jgi:hypothetical protein